MDLGNYIPAIKYGHLVDNDEINPALAQSKTVTLTSAQILAMSNFPVTLVTPTAAGQAIIVESAVFEVPYIGTSASTYTAGGAIVIGYNGSTATGAGAVSGTITGNSLLTATAAGYWMVAQTNSSGGAKLPVNVGVSIGNQTTPFLGGTNTAQVTLNYYIVTL